MFNYKRVISNNVTFCIFRRLCKKQLNLDVLGQTGRADQRSFILEKLSNQPNYSETWINTVKNETIALGNSVNDFNFDGVFLETCIQNGFAPMCRAHFKHLLDEKKLKLAVIGKYFRFCYEFKETCSESDKLLLEKMFSEISSKHETLDPITCENLILGLSITKKWKECLPLLKICQEFSGGCMKAQSAVVKAFFENGEFEEGWNQIKCIIESGFKPSNVVYDVWLDIPHLHLQFKIDRMLTFMQTYQLRIPEETSKKVLLLKSASLSKIMPSGKCSNCSAILNPVSISSNEFLKLKKDFLEPVLVGRDIFLKSEPSELKSFKTFLETSGPTDVVLDGLNISYSAGLRGSAVGAKFLRDVVHHFKKNGMNVMVLGRKHMYKWPAKHMKFITSNSEVFFVDNLSHDDPLVLFAAMAKGLGTKFVSRDLMRSQKYLVKSNVQEVFFKWQQLHQLFLSYVNDDGTVHLKEWRKHALYAVQSNKNSWHVPIEELPPPGVAPNVHASRLTWLCFS